MSERANFRGRGGARSGGHSGGGDHHGGQSSNNRGGGRGGGGGGGGGGYRGGGYGGGSQQQAEKPKKENILDLTKYMDKAITVKFTGGREGWCTPSFSPASMCTLRMIYGVPFSGVVRLGRSGGMQSYHLSFGCVLIPLFGNVTVVGTLKGYDQLMNLVLDDVKELLRGTSVLPHPPPTLLLDVLYTTALINRTKNRLT